MTAASTARAFLRAFEEEPAPEPAERFGAGSGPPLPEQTDVTDESVQDYQALDGANGDDGYGVTGLMAVTSFGSRCNGRVLPGTVFLFPGVNESFPPPWSGPLPAVDCVAHAPLRREYPIVALHRQLCDLLKQPPHAFVGFSAVYPVEEPGNIGYNSATCNIGWFDSRALPPQWQALVRDTLLTYLA